MFLHELGSSDSRFKRLKFHDGMNILLADKTTESNSGDSRNGAGKTSFIRIVRYILGGGIGDTLKAETLSGHSFWAELDFGKMTEPLRVERPVSPRTRIYIDGAATSVDDWKRKLSTILGIPDSARKPTVSQLFAQLVRDYFGDPLKTHR